MITELPKLNGEFVLNLYSFTLHFDDKTVLPAQPVEILDKFKPRPQGYCNKENLKSEFKVQRYNLSKEAYEILEEYKNHYKDTGFIILAPDELTVFLQKYPVYFPVMHFSGGITFYKSNELHQMVINNE